MSATVSTREWRDAVTAFARDSEKDAVTVVNRSMESILYRAPYSLIRRTYRQTKAGIRKDLKGKSDLLIRMATQWLESKGRPVNDRSVGHAAQRILLARQKSVKYIVAGWAPAAADFGATRIRPPGGKSKAAKGYGRKATPRKMEAVAVNTVGSELRSARVWQDAFNSMDTAIKKEADDLLKRLGVAIDKRARERSGR